MTLARIVVSPTALQQIGKGVAGNNACVGTKWQFLPKKQQALEHFHDGEGIQEMYPRKVTKECRRMPI